MSVQEAIDSNVKTAKGRYLHSFTVIGESGDADVPRDVHVRFYNCQIGSLTLNGNNNIFMESGLCGPIVGEKATVSARGTVFSDEVSLEASKLDLFAITSTGLWRLKARSHLRADNSKFSGSAFAGDFQEGSHGRYTRCNFSGHGTAAIKADGGSFVLLAKCPQIIGVKALWAKDRSVIQAVECPVITGSATYALHAEDYGRIEALQCATVKGQVQALFGDTNGFLLCNKCDDIIGNSDSAVFLDNHAGMEIRKFKTIRGQGNSAIRGINLNSVFVLGGQLIKSDGKDGIELLNGGHGHVVSVQTITGTGRDGIHLDETSELYVNDVITVEGKAANGTYLGNKSILQLYEVVTVKGTGRSGAFVDTEARLASFFVENFIGEAGDGITLGDGAYASVQGAAAITGQAGHGVEMGEGATLLLSRCQAVTGQAGDGINAGEGCQITLQRGTSVTGQSGTGIVAGDGSTVNVVGTEAIVGAAADGIRATGALVKIRKVGAVTGSSGKGINLTASDLEAVLCPAITGVSDGISSSGEGAGQTRLKLDRCVVTGATNALNVNETFVESRGTVYTGSMALLAQASHIQTISDSFVGNATLTDSIYDQWGSTVSGIFTLSGGAMIGALGSAASSYVSAGAVLAAGFDMGAVALASGYLALIGGSATVSGTGAVLSMGAGEPSAGIAYIDFTVSSLKMRDQWGDVFQLSGSSISFTAITSIVADAPLYDWH